MRKMLSMDVGSNVLPGLDEYTVVERDMRAQPKTKIAISNYFDKFSPRPVYDVDYQAMVVKVLLPQPDDYDVYLDGWTIVWVG